MKIFQKKLKNLGKNSVSIPAAAESPGLHDINKSINKELSILVIPSQF